MHRFLLTCAALIGCAAAGSAADNGALTVELAKMLLPEAAGMRNADFKALADDPRPDRIESKSLSLTIWSIDPKIARDNLEAAKDFQFLGDELPRPDEIAAAMAVSKNKGYCSCIQPAYISDCTCESTAEKAEGTVTFKNKLYAGHVRFRAIKKKDGWAITEFQLPNYKIKIVRGEDGVWMQQARLDK